MGVPQIEDLVYKEENVKSYNGGALKGFHNGFVLCGFRECVRPFFRELRISYH